MSVAPENHLAIIPLVFVLIALQSSSASARTRPVEHTFDSNGVEISYTDEGAGVPVVLVSTT